MSISQSVWTWFMAISILAIFSSLYKENQLYRAAEHVLVGGTAGHALGVAVGVVYRLGWQPLLRAADISLVVPIVLGLMLYTRCFNRLAWLSSLPVAFLVGVGGGQTLYTFLRTQVVLQSLGAITKLPGATLGATLNGLITVFGTVAVLLSFAFSLPHQGAVRHVSRAGRWIVMVAFGVSLGNIVAGQITTLLGQLQILFSICLGL